MSDTGRPTPAGRAATRPTPAGRPRPTPVGRSRPTPTGRATAVPPTATTPPRRSGGLLGSLPFLFAVAAATLLASSAVTWVLSPHWGGEQGVIAAPRDVGTVPTKAGATVQYVSPDRIVIPAIDASARIVKVGTLPGRLLEIPLDPKVAGWWKYGAKPGASKGTAIIAGHINYGGVTGEFASIGTLDPGDRVYVWGRRSGHETRLEFRITGVRTYKKTALPYATIFDQQSVGRLAIVTCGGMFDASTGNYVDNIVAFAVPVRHAAA